MTILELAKSVDFIAPSQYYEADFCMRPSQSRP